MELTFRRPLNDDGVQRFVPEISDDDSIESDWGWIKLKGLKRKKRECVKARTSSFHNLVE
jgi:hypothetical protein